MTIRALRAFLGCYLTCALATLPASPAASAVSTIAWGEPGGGQGEFAFQVFPGIAADRNGDVWVTDQGNNRVEEFTGEGTFIRALGCASDASTPCSPSSADGQFNYPSGVAADLTRNELYVSDRFNDRVEVFSTISGGFLRSWTMTSPIGIAVDRTGHVFVDAVGGVIIRSDRDGTGRMVVTQSPVQGDATDQLATSDKGDLFTVFFDNQTGTRDVVQKFTSLGVLATASPQVPSVDFFGPSFSPGGPTAGQVTVANYGYPSMGEALYTFSSALRSPSTASPSAGGQTLSRPEATAYDCAGNLYVVDGDNGRIVKLVYGTGSAACPGSGGLSAIARQAIGTLVGQTPTISTVRVGCALRNCAGLIQLLAAGRAVGTATFKVPGNSARTLSLKLDARGRALLRSGRRISFTVVTASHGKTIRRNTTVRPPTVVSARCPGSLTAGVSASVAGVVRGARGGGVPQQQIAINFAKVQVAYTRSVVRSGAGGRYSNSFTPTAPGRLTIWVNSLGDRTHAPAVARCTVTVRPAPPITLGTGRHPTVVVDSAGTAHAVWAHPNADGTDGLTYCRIPVGATACQGTTELPPLPGGLSAPFLLMRADGTLVVIDSRPNGDTYAVTSSDGGSTWQAPVVVGGNFGEDDVRLTPDGQSADRIYGATGSNTFQRTPLAGPAQSSSINLDAGPSGDVGDWYFGQIAYLPNGNPMVVFGDLTNLAYRVYGGGNLYDQSSWSPFPPAVIGEGSYDSLTSGPGGIFLLSLGTGSSSGRIELRSFASATGFSPPVRLSPASESSAYDPALVEDPAGGLTAAWVDNGSLIYRRADPAMPFGAPQTVFTAPVTGNVYNLRLGASSGGSRWAVWDDNSSTGQAHALRLP